MREEQPALNMTGDHETAAARREGRVEFRDPSNEGSSLAGEPGQSGPGPVWFNFDLISPWPPSS